MYACLHQVPRAWANRAKASDGLVCILITRASNPKNSRVFQINNVPYNTLQISISFSTTMRNSITKGYKGGCQWNWHFSNGFLSGKQISIALLEVKVKQNLLYNTLESFRIASCCCFLWPGCTGGWSPVWKSCGVASPWPEETRHVTSKSLPNSHYLKLPSIDKKVRLSFLPSSWWRRAWWTPSPSAATANSGPDCPFFWSKPVSISKHDQIVKACGLFVHSYSAFYSHETNLLYPQATVAG